MVNKKPPEAFRNACHKFILTEVLRPISQAKNEAVNTKSSATPKPKKTTPAPSKSKSTAESSTTEFPKEFVLQALENSCDDSGWANLATFGSYLTKLKPDFDSRLYGFKKLSDLVKTKTDLFRIEERKLSGSDKKVLYLRSR